jgi:hypothetical protein
MHLLFHHMHQSEPCVNAGFSASALPPSHVMSLQHDYQKVSAREQMISSTSAPGAAALAPAGSSGSSNSAVAAEVACLYKDRGDMSLKEGEKIK